MRRLVLALVLMLIADSGVSAGPCEPLGDNTLGVVANCVIFAGERTTTVVQDAS